MNFRDRLKGVSRRITFIDARYLKHSGALMDVKVTFEIVDGAVFARFRRVRTADLRVALRHLQNIADTELAFAREFADSEVAS